MPLPRSTTVLGRRAKASYMCSWGSYALTTRRSLDTSAVLLQVGQKLDARIADGDMHESALVCDPDGR